MNKTIKIDGMSCNHCVATVEKALGGVPGVSNIKVDLAANSATVTAGAGVTDDALKAAVEDTGFDVTGIE